MPEFNYIALNAAATEVHGVIDASSEKEAVALLRGQGYYPTSVTSAAPADSPLSATHRMRFVYIALDAAGKEVTGTIDTDSQDEAVATLRSQGLFPTRVVPFDATSATLLASSDESNSFAAKLVIWFFVGLGSFILLAGLIWSIKTAVFVVRAAKAPGFISEVEVVKSDGKNSYYPHFTYADAAGVRHSQRSSIGYPSSPFARGDGVSVLYDPSSPELAKIDSFKGVWLGPLAILGFGAVFTTFACFFLKMSRVVVRPQQREAMLRQGGAAPG